MIHLPVAVASRTFSKNTILRTETLQKFSNVKFNDDGVKFDEIGLNRFLSGCSGAIVALEPINQNSLQHLSQLRVISKYGVGLDNVDQSYLKSQNIQLGWTGGVNATAVAELALTMILGTVRNVFPSTFEMANGVWANKGGRDLSKKTVGVVGCGFVGSELLRFLQPFQCRVLVHDCIDKSSVCRKYGAEFVSLQSVFANSDVISFHVPLTDTTHHMVNAKTISQMKPGVVLVNTSRGGVFHEADLLGALNSGHVLSAASDVFEKEPYLGGELVKHPRFFATPHIGGSSEEAILAMGRSAIQNLYDLLQKETR